MNAARIMLPTLKCHANYGFHELYRFRFGNSNRIVETQSNLWKCILKTCTNIHNYIRSFIKLVIARNKIQPCGKDHTKNSDFSELFRF